MSLPLGFIGLGTMGQPMALNLCRAGHPLTVFNRTAARAEPLRAAGARVAASPLEAAAASQILFLNVADDAALEAVLFGPDGAAAGLAPGRIVVDHGTSSLAITRTCAERLAQRGVTWLDAPVSGGEAGAKAGTLSIMVGGPDEAYARVLPLLRAMGGNVVHVGTSGAGQVAKACNQIVVSATLMGVAEALTFARREAVDPVKVREALLGGFASSRILEVHGQRMLDESFPPGFKARLHRKDLGLVLDEARRIGQTLPATAAAARTIDALVAAGEGEFDSSALIHVIQSLTNTPTA
ncbi:MAG: NAD(P)-dependent oxidoreductase [Pseudomonadota bacterium]